MKKKKFCFLLCFIFVLYFPSTLWAKYEIDKTYIAAVIQIRQENFNQEIEYEQNNLENQEIQTITKNNETT